MLFISDPSAVDTYVTKICYCTSHVVDSIGVEKVFLPLLDVKYLKCTSFRAVLIFAQLKCAKNSYTKI